MILVFGYLCGDNYGDEILASIVEKQYPDSVRLSKENSLWQHLKLIYKAEKIIAIGGLFQDLSSPLSPFYYSLVLFYSWLTRTEISILAQGIGPLSSPWSKLSSYFALRLATNISVRDLASSDLLQRLDLDHYYGSDLAWNLVEDYKKQKDTIEIDLPLAKNYLVLALRQLRPYEDYKELLEQVLASATELPVMLLEMQPGDNDQVKELLGDREFIEIKAHDYKPEQLIYLLAKSAKTIVSMRLHALILAHIAGLELKAISYDPKLEQLQLQIHRFELEELNRRAHECLEAQV